MEHLHKGLETEIAVGDHHRPHSEVDIPPLNCTLCTRMTVTKVQTFLCIHEDLYKCIQYLPRYGYWLLPHYSCNICFCFKPLFPNRHVQILHIYTNA